MQRSSTAQKDRRAHLLLELVNGLLGALHIILASHLLQLIQLGLYLGLDNMAWTVLLGS